MPVFRLLSLLVPFLMSLVPAGGGETEYTWTGQESHKWNVAANWSPASVPGASSSNYAHWLVTSETASRGWTDVGALGDGGRCLKGIRIAGVNSGPEGKLRFFIMNTSSGVYLRVHDGGITVKNAEEGAGSGTDFGIAQLRVAADQTWDVAEGRSFYLGQDTAAPTGIYSLTSEGDVPRRVTLTGGGAVRLGERMLADNISGEIGFVLNAGRGKTTLDLADRGVSNPVTVEDAGRLEGMSLYQGVLSTGGNSSVTFAETSVKASARWSVGPDTAFTLEDATLDLTEAGVDGQVTLSGTSGISGKNGSLKQTILDDARITYADRDVQAGELLSVGKNVTITLDNASIHFNGAVPEMNLVVQGACTLEGEGDFTGKITYAPGSSLTVKGSITLPSVPVALGRVHVTAVDGVPQDGAEQPRLPAQQAKEYVVQFDSSMEELIAEWPGAHTLAMEFRDGRGALVTVTDLPKGATSWQYDSASGVLTLGTAKPEMPANVSGSRPNIIFVLVDDMGWGDLEVNWSHPEKNGRTVARRHTFRTPNLNRMAEEGMQLRRHYTAAPLCAPARASLMLGVHQGHSRVIRNKKFDFPLENSHTLGTVLKSAGYHTAAIGKWGIGGGGQSQKQETARPDARGFDYFYGVMAHLAGHYHYPTGPNTTEASGKVKEVCKVVEYDALDPSSAWSVINGRIPATAYDTDLYGARAKKWIVDHHSKSPSQPFFLYLAFPAPHACVSVPACAYPEGRGRDKGLQWRQWTENGAVYEACNTATEELAREAGVAGNFSPNTYIYEDNRNFSKPVARHHSTMIRRVDDVVADLIQTLKDLGIDDNTMIVFTSDNGPHTESGAGNYNSGQQDPTFFQSYGILDGMKQDMWEGGWRVPTIVRWPAAVKGSGISLHPSQFHDWMATFADAAGVPVPARCDGVSLLPMLAGVPERQRESTIYSEYRGNPTFGLNSQDFLPEHRRDSSIGEEQAIYIDGYKGVRVKTNSADQDFLIYDTARDPQESTDLAASRPGLQAQMKAQVLRMRRSCPVDTTARSYLDSVYTPSVERPARIREGLRWRSWRRGFDWVPDFRQLEEAPSATGITASLEVNADPAVRKGVELTGYLYVPKAGQYQFYLRTDANEGSRAFVHLHDMQLIDADYAYTPGAEADSGAREGVAQDVSQARQKVYLAEGYHPIRISYIGGSSASLSMEWESADAGLARQAIPSTAFFHDGVDSFSISKTEESIASEACSTPLTVQVREERLPWTASCDQPWVTVSPASGTETATLDIAVEANHAAAERTAVVTVSCNGGQKAFTLVQAAAAPPAGYEKWKKEHFPDDEPEDRTSPDACPAGDGITNLMKYATGLDPNKPCGSVTVLTTREENGKRYMALSWPVNPDAVDVAFSVESSTDLKSWTDEGEVVPSGARGEYRDSVAIDEGSPLRRFLRLKVTGN